jgi:hypothetical protein
VLTRHPRSPASEVFQDGVAAALWSGYVADRLAGLGRNGDRNPGTAVEKSVATLDTYIGYFASERRWRCPQNECPRVKS